MKLLELAQVLKPGYTADWYHELIAGHLERCAAGDSEVPNLLISTPPGSGKTELVSILFPAYVFAHDPRAHAIALANSDNLARIASGNVLRLIQYPEFQARFPLQLDKQAEGQWTIAGGDGRPSMHASGIGGQLTGHRADYLIFDDLVKWQSDAMSEVVRERIWSDFSSAAETRLLPTGKIIGIQTRWHLSDPIGEMLRRAQEDKRARQFVYISLAAWNSGEDSFILNTRKGEKTYLPKYKALATKEGQPYSFSRTQLQSKQADLGPSRWAALYMQTPLSGEDQLFPASVWRTYDGPVNGADIALITTGWDCASKTHASNDYSANVVIAALRTGGCVVLDVWKSKVTFAELPAIVLERYALLSRRFGQLPLLVIEDSSAGTQLCQILKAQFGEIPLLEVKPIHSKVLRAEGVTPMTRGGSVVLPRDAEWRDAFIHEMAEFPVGVHDDVVDAFVHACRPLCQAGAFRKADWSLLPGAQPTEAEIRDADFMRELAERQNAISPDLDEYERLLGIGEDW